MLPLTVAVLVVLAAADSGAAEASASQVPPNIVLIVGDDHGYADFGFMGSEDVQTPNLDRLASEGVVFPTTYVTASICVPSLRSMLTGLYPLQWESRLRTLATRGIQRPPGERLQDFETLPRLLERHGYRSFQGGKLHATSYEVAGFGDGVQQPGDAVNRGGTGRFVGRELGLGPVFGFVDREDTRPFFLWFAPMLPHQPFDAPERFRAPYVAKGYREGGVRYYANVTRFDELVGELLAHLRERGLLENTLVVYLADNGWEAPRKPGERRAPEVHARGKETMHELGFRTPLVLRWPGRVPVAVRDELVSSVDLFPTLVDYAGIDVPGDLPGHSLRPVVEGRGKWPRKRLVGSMDRPRSNRYRPARLPPRQADRPERAWFLRDSRWHYIWYRAWGTHALYDLEEDPREREDVAAARPAMVNRFRRQIESWRAQMEAVPSGSGAYPPAAPPPPTDPPAP